ncbi:bifunctional helix-turn-helix transcriptional regulator/GNAT family N-acetyltransferase [Candidatus Uabimicrobium amorphum]|uniref:MarR family transcriptional regulator n=1 Tax=Uabimicrobium amorphum TaxID=2596890 RepID=A0A5S9IMT3_UABAM|nr:bifunctional helix-turn-helix transcriptional regulator/GNAT family N-acetyltransferase [Candidatus Uabimicrobium amorphum]BBM84594.1 MarR family transcriptional regulator [Candidatus Uabimicrobium amorphum]
MTATKMHNEFVSSVRQSSRGMVRELGLLAGRHQKLEVTYSEGHTLLEVEKHKMLTIGDLAKILQLDKSTMSRVVYELIQKGCLEYSQNPNDRRQKLVHLTPQGQKQVDAINNVANSHVQRALDLLTAKEQKLVEQGLALYAKALANCRQEQEFTVREITKEDNAAMASIVRRVLAEFEFSGPGTAADDTELEDMFATYNKPKTAYFIAVKDNRVIGGGGFAPLKGSKSDICELQKMYLLPEARGLGLGEKLLRQSLEKAKEMGYKKCYLETAFAMNKARNLYKKLGFTELKKSMGDTGHYRCECWYIKEL